MRKRNPHTLFHDAQVGGQVQIYEVLTDLNHEIIQERHDKIKEIEQQVTELNEMFKDLQNIIAIQNPLIEKIAEKIENSVDHATHAVKEVTQAENNSRSSTCQIL